MATGWQYCWVMVFGEQHEVLAPDPSYKGEFWYIPPGGKRQRVDEALETLGEQGWELAGIAPASYNRSWGEAYRMYFKRPADLPDLPIPPGPKI